MSPTHLTNPAPLRGSDVSEDKSRNDPHLPAVLSLTDADGTIEVHIRPSAVYEPTL